MSDFSKNLSALLASGVRDFRKNGEQPDGAMEQAYRNADRKARAMFPIEMDGSPEVVAFIAKDMQRQLANEATLLIDAVKRDYTLSPNLSSIEKTLEATRPPKPPQPERSKFGSFFWRDQDMVRGADGSVHTPTSEDGRRILQQQRAQEAQRRQTQMPPPRQGGNLDTKYLRPDQMVSENGHLYQGLEAQRIRERRAADEAARQRAVAEVRNAKPRRELSAAERNAALPPLRK